MSVAPSSYKQYVLENYGELSAPQMAEHIGIPLTSLRSSMNRWKKKNPELFPLVAKAARPRKSHLYQQYVLDNYGKMSNKEIAEHVGITVDCLRSQISHWRRKGFDIQHSRVYKNAGDTSVRQYKGELRLYIKRDDGRWQLAESKPRYVPPKAVKIDKKPPRVLLSIKSSLKEKYDRNHNVKPIVIKKEEGNKVPFYIPELRLTVWVDPNANCTAIREKYLSHQQFMLKSK